SSRRGFSSRAEGTRVVERSVPRSVPLHGQGIFGEKHSRSLVAGAVRIFPPSLYTTMFVFNRGPRESDDGCARRGRSHRGDLRPRGVFRPPDAEESPNASLRAVGF